MPKPEVLVAPHPSACIVVYPIDEGGTGMDTTPYWTTLKGDKRWRIPDGEPMPPG
jgi:hypothetical protein